MAVSAEIDRVTEQGNCLMPDINICHADLANPTEAIVTKIMVHYLRCFGFRLDPPHKMVSEPAHSSRESRVFLIRLCRQIERIIQISFPNKTYSYMDIIKPAVKKTLATLSYLFNYLAYYKVFKKNVLGPVEEAIKLKDSLTAEIKAKSQQLEHSKEYEVAISQIKKELQDTQAKLLQLKKSSSEQNNGLELLEQQQAELEKRISHWEEQVVEEAQVKELRDKIKSAYSHVESYKAELATKEQVTNEHRRVIESSQEVVSALEKATASLSLIKLEDHKDSCKELDSMEKQVPKLESNYQKQRQLLEAKKQELFTCGQQYESQKQNHNAEDQKLQKQLESLKFDMENNSKRLQEFDNRIMEIDQRTLGQEQLHAILMDHICKTLGENWQLIST
ncbi:microtubule-associated tumor suppressor 1 homolog A [Drosophila ficusphila]|uniref:microtubule-associated tumor suppressor 1 homolog A n=1 Tax=Drosophila ficusphila TaxID=30025 RepID=UPI0007E739A5|nr:microtubule-associated tumor suppressor 1 homolog A [Drosophila ficusphila]